MGDGHLGGAVEGYGTVAALYKRACKGQKLYKQGHWSGRYNGWAAVGSIVYRLSGSCSWKTRLY